MARNRLTDTAAVRRELGKLYYEVREGTITEAKAQRLNAILNVLLKALAQLWQEGHGMELQERLAALEGEENE